MLARMFEKRLRGYRAIGYARGQAPLGYAEAEDDVVIEYDDALVLAAETLGFGRTHREPALLVSLGLRGG